jgi:hypothetical protein
MALFLVDRLGGIGDGLVQIVVPGEKEIVLEPGYYTIFHERESVVDGRIYQSNGIAGLEVSLTDPAGDPVALTTASMSANYNIPGHRGVSAFQFEATTAGTYRLSAAYPAAQRGPRRCSQSAKDSCGSSSGPSSAASRLFSAGPASP